MSETPPFHVSLKWTLHLPFIIHIHNIYIMDPTYPIHSHFLSQRLLSTLHVYSSVTLDTFNMTYALLLI